MRPNRDFGKHHYSLPKIPSQLTESPLLTSAPADGFGEELPARRCRSGPSRTATCGQDLSVMRLRSRV